MRFAYPCPNLNQVDYPSRLLEAAGSAQPGTECSLMEALETAVDISIASAHVSKTDADGTPLLNGPFGAVRLAVRREELYRYLQLLQAGSESSSVKAAELAEIDGTVVGLGWNSVNSAHLDNQQSAIDPTAHAEIAAIRAASQALGIPMGLWRSRNLVCIEAASSCNCDMCRAANDLWAGTALSLYAAARQEVCSNGFTESNNTHTEPSSDLEWGHTLWDQPSTRCTQIWAGLFDSELPARARDAFAAFSRNRGTPYQPTVL